SISQVWQACFAATRAVGLTHGICIVPTDNFGAFQIIASAMPKGCLEGYIDNGLLAGDLVLDRARLSVQSFQWEMKDWDVSQLTPLQRRWREHCVAHGING